MYTCLYSNMYKVYIFTIKVIPIMCENDQSEFSVNFDSGAFPAHIDNTT